MYKHAQMDDNGIVTGISFLAGIVTADNMVLLDGSGENDDIIDIGWRLAGGEWFPPERMEPTEQVIPVSLEELKEYTLLNMQLTLEAIEMIEGGAGNGK